MSEYIHKSHHVSVWLDHLVFPAKSRKAVFDPRYTSQTCSRCHHVHPEQGKSYRNGKVFRCGHCGLEIDSDWNGALNVAQLGGSVSNPEHSVYACNLKGQINLFPTSMV